MDEAVPTPAPSSARSASSNALFWDDVIIGILVLTVVFLIVMYSVRDGFVGFEESSFDMSGHAHHLGSPMFGGSTGSLSLQSLPGEEDDPGIATLREYAQMGSVENGCGTTCLSGASNEMQRSADTLAPGARTDSRYCYNSLRRHQDQFLGPGDGLHPETGVGIGPLSYHHYEGLPPNWSLPVIPRVSEGCGEARLPVPSLEDAPTAEQQMRAAMFEAEYPSHYDHLPIKLQGAEAARVYGVLRDPDHEPMMGATSY